MNLKHFLIFCITLINFHSYKNSYCQFSGARDYLNTPVPSYGGNIIYSYTTGNSILQGNLSTDGEINNNTYYPDFEGYFSVAGRLVSVQAYSGYGSISSSGTVEIITQDDTITASAQSGLTGFSDLTIYFTTNIIGAPAMNQKQFDVYSKKSKPETNLSARLFVNVPVGNYDKSTLVNFSANRWTFMPEISFTQQFGKNFYLALYTNAEFYTDNTEFLDSNVIKQDPLWGIDIHPSYTIFPEHDFWISIDAMIDLTGTSFINGINQNTNGNSITLGSTIESDINDSQGLSLQYLKTLPESERPVWQLYFTYSYFF